jgi:hypothetical protein
MYLGESMEASPLPEIAWLRELVLRIQQNKGDTPAIHAISDYYAAIAGLDDRNSAFRLLVNTLDKVERLVPEIASPGARKTAERVLLAYSELLDPTQLATPLTHFRSTNSARLQLIEAAISSLEDLRYDATALQARAIDFFEEIERLKAQFATSDDISDASKVILRAQLDLVGKSLTRMSNSGVGAFRDSVFTAFGRIVIELKADSGTNNRGVAEGIDGFLKLYAIAEAGGTMLKLTGEGIKLLTAS